MADTPPRRRSPLAGLADRLAGAGDAPERIRLAEVPFLTQLTLRVAPESAVAAAVAAVLGAPLPTTPNTTCRSGDAEVLWMGPDEWLVVASAGADGLLEALEQVVGAEHATVVDVSDQRTAIDVAGADARDLLRKGCALDVDPRTFGVGRCAQTLLARAQVVLVPRLADEPAYRVLVRASFAEYLAEWLLDAAAEYRGIAPLILTPQRSATVITA